MIDKKELILKIKKNHLFSIQEMIKETSVEPFIQIFCQKESEENPMMMYMPLTNDLLDQDADFFKEKIFPSIKKSIEEEGLTILLVVFTSEAWVTKVDKNDPSKKSEKQEVVIFNYSSEKGDEIEVYDVIRDEYEVDESGEFVIKSHTVDKDGNLCENIKIEYNAELSGDDIKSSKGRFINLFKQLT